jgi:hypothetical protein
MLDGHWLSMYMICEHRWPEHITSPATTRIHENNRNVPKALWKYRRSAGSRDVIDA